MNGEMGWSIDQGEAATATIRFRPQRTYRIAMGISLLALIACVVLLFWGRRERS